MIRSIENGRIRLTVSDSGAEIISALDKKTRRELVWCGDPAWWKRHTPVLFPIVGSIWENTMRVDGKEYHMSQHGFARDMDFTCIEETENSLAYELKSNEETLSKFPWKFTLRLIHSLDGSRVITRWEVTNDDSTDMYFQIGGHPAFNMPEGIKDTDKVAGFIRFGENDAESYKISSIGSKGCVKAEDSVLDCPGREIAITAGMFANDAIIFEENPPRVISIYDTDNKLVIKFGNNGETLGIWSPARSGYAPFICIEPWYGRTDREGYTGEFSTREHILKAAPGATLSDTWFFEI